MFNIYIFMDFYFINNKMEYLNKDELYIYNIDKIYKKTVTLEVT